MEAVPHDVAAHIAQIKATADVFRNTNTRQVQGGFVVAGMTQYNDKVTGGVLLSENAEGIAQDTADAGYMVSNYLEHGKFQQYVPEADAAQPSLFEQEPAPEAPNPFTTQSAAQVNAAVASLI